MRQTTRCRAARAKVLRKPCRRGVAPLEFTLFLPWVIVMLMLYLTVASSVMTSMEVEISVRRDVWLRRHAPWQDDPRSSLQLLGISIHPDTTMVLGDQVRIDPRTAITTQRKATPATFLLGFEGMTTQASHTILGGGVWDYDEIDFEPQGEHPRLTPTDKFYYFTNKPVDFDRFQDLASFASAGMIATQATTQAQSNAAAAAFAPHADVASVGSLQNELASAELQLKQYEAQLATALAEDPPDEDLIAELKSQISEVHSTIAYLKIAIAKLKMAR